MTFNPMEESLAKCNICGSIFHEYETVVLGQHFRMENKTVCFFCCARMCEQQYKRIAELEQENERLRSENKTTLKNKCCCNCSSKECDTINCRVRDTSYAIDCLVNNRKNWKSKEVTND